MIIQTLEELESDLKVNGLRNFYVILGEEFYLVHSALKLLIGKALARESRFLDYAEFKGGDSSAPQILQSASTFPMSAKRRVTVVSEANKLKEEEQEKLVNSLRNQEISPRSVLIFVAEDLDHRKKFYRSLLQVACLVELRRLKGYALERWAQYYLDKEGYRISPASLKRIVELAGEDLQTLSMELEKLILYAGRGKTIPDTAVDSVISDNRQHNIFELLDAIGRRDYKSALRLLGNLLQSGESPLGVVAMMARYCRQVLVAQECLVRGIGMDETARMTQASSYFLEKLLSQARASDTDLIRRMYVQLAEIDRQLKSSAADGQALLEKLICELV